MADFAPDLLHRLVWQLDRAADQLLRARLGVSFGRAIFLFTLKRRGTLTQHELALALGYSDPAVSTMLKELRADGFVTTAPSPDHGRKRLVKLTPEGRAVVSKGRALLAGDYSRLMKSARVNQEQYAVLTRRVLQALLSRGEPRSDGGTDLTRRARS